MRIPVLLVTYNRIEYSKKALTALVENAGVPIELNIWDNGSQFDTVQWLLNDVKSWCKETLVELKLNDSNQGLAAAMNWFFSKYRDAQYVVKVDNDTVLPAGWLKDLAEGMEMARHPLIVPDGKPIKLPPPSRIGAVSATCLRPSGPTFNEWVRDNMVTVDADNGYEYFFNSYVLGTGVLINMDMIRELGLLFEYFPYGPETPTYTVHDVGGKIYQRPEKTCLISGWTAYTRIACDYHGWKFAFYSRVHANLLNLKAEHVLSNDYPEYDEELKDARDQGNKWWESVGGLPGVKKYVEEHGGMEKLSQFVPPPTPMSGVMANQLAEMNEMMDRAMGAQDLETLGKVRRRYLTDCDQHYERSTQTWWEERVRKEGVSRAIFLDQTQARTNEFTAIHEQIIRREIKPHMRILECGAGWGRCSALIAKLAGSYIGTDFVEQLLETARETLPKLDFRYADAGALPFAAGEFDAVVAVTCVSSFDERFDAVMKEMLRVVNRDGFVLLLEEEWSRKTWKLEHK